MNANVIEVKPFNITKIELVALRGPKGETGYPTPEQVQTAVDAWLEDHPEATTTVQDGAITTVKLHDGAVTEDKLAESLQSLLITDTASGSIASFSDGSDGINVRDLKVHVEPVQDLHGYSNPWPGGGNSNLLPELSTQTKNGLTFTADRGQYTVSGTPSATTDFDVTVSIPVGTYTFAAFNPATSNYAYLILITQSGTGNPSAQLTAVNRTYTFTTTETSVKFRVRFYTGQTFSNFKLSPMLVSGSTAPSSFTPYSNICPIEGFDSAKVFSTGRNIFENTGPASSSYRGITFTKNSNGSVKVNGTCSGGTSYYVISGGYFNNAVPIPSWMIGKTFTISGGTSNVDIAFYIYNASGTGRFYLADDTSTTFTTNLDSVYYGFFVSVENGTTVSNETVYPQIEIGSTATAYEQYQGTTITIPLGSTVYGGTLDVTTGVLTVDRAMVDIGTLTWETIHTGSTRKAIRTSLPSAYPGYPNQTLDMVQTTYKFAGYVSSASGLSSPDSKDLGFYMYRNTTNTTPQTIYMVVDSNATPSGTLVYKIATPTTVQLTPQQMSTLLGVNNVWSDAGDVDVTYVADTKLYIAKMIANALNS